jgi:hypothetical protein
MAFRSIGERIDSMLCTATLLAALAITQSPPTSALAPRVDSAKSSKLKEGDLVRVNVMDSGRHPAFVMIYPSLEQARAAVLALPKLIREKRISSREGLIQVGHNTPAKIERISMVDFFGRETRYAQVTLGSGGLNGQQFWIPLTALRDAREPDPARMALDVPLDAPLDAPADAPADEPAEPRFSGDVSWDPDYRPKVGDSTVLGSRNGNRSQDGIVGIKPL